MYTVKLTPEEMNDVYEVAENAIAQVGVGRVHNKDYGDGRQFGAGRLERNIEGFMAEMAFAKHFDVPFNDYEIQDDKSDGNIDLVVNDLNVGVKSTRHQRGHLVVKKRELTKAIVPDYYFLGVVDIDKASVDLVGYFPTRLVRKYACEHSTKDSWWIKQRHLREFE